MKAYTYKKDKLKEIRFGLGGIGTGSISLAGNGHLVDWEIMNHPNKGWFNRMSHFAVRAEKEGEVLDARILQGDWPPPYTGSPERGVYWGEGFGPNRSTLAGLPNFRNCTFKGTYPFAEIKFRDKHLPGKVRLSAFNPFIPLNAHDSGIPAAFFEIEIKNTSDSTLTYSTVGNLNNCLPPNQVNKTARRKGLSVLHLTTDGVAELSPKYGDLAIATDAEQTSYQLEWFRGAWFDALEVYWRDLNTAGPFKNRKYNAPAETKNGDCHALLAAHIKIEPGESRTVRFVIAWNYPNCENYWNCGAEEAARKAGVSPTWKNWYATQWKDAVDSAAYALRNWERLEAETRRFHDALFGSTLPPEVLEAVSANLSTLKSPTVLRLEDGTFYGFEGCHAKSGCCPGSCTHVWNYAQALPFLFPELERSMRTADYKYNQQENGGMPFRLELPLGIQHEDDRSCADGLFGNVMVTYRDWKISGDDGWLKSLWPNIKKAIEYAWRPDNMDKWDPNRTGVLWGRQHHTLDMELFGPSSWLCGFYLGALKAAAEMARYLGEEETAEDYEALFEKGYAFVDSELFNGEYFFQKVDLYNKNVLAPYDAEHYWDEEHGEIKYQIDEGSSIDQVLPQFHANLYGLGDIYDPAKVKKAAKALYRHNFHKSFREVYNPCRLFAVNDEAGIVICEWPEDRRKPAIPAVYAQECMNGFEYSAAVLMIQNGMVKKGLELVRAVRERYDGEKRNPWNEIECGSHYARSMASYALLNALSGFQFDKVRGMIGFDPAVKKRPFRCFWCLDGAWGTVTFKKSYVEIKVDHGDINIRQLHLSSDIFEGCQCITSGEEEIAFSAKGGALGMEEIVSINSNSPLRVRFA